MRKLLNTLFVTNENAYGSLDGENVVIKEKNEEIARYPLHLLEGIYLFTYAGCSPALMGKCADRGVSISFLTPGGKFLARTVGETAGNIHLRKAQYRFSDSEEDSLTIARNFIIGKINGERVVIDRARRNHPDRVDAEKFIEASHELKDILFFVRYAESLDSLRGFEGQASKKYFSCFDDMILGDKENFFFHERSKRPPLDRVNALLSYCYTLLTNECVSALEMVGLDSEAGFLHRDRSGRKSLACDLIEELRAPVCDRFALSLINNRQLSADDFDILEDGAVYLNRSGRTTVLKEWQQRKSENIIHPYLGEKIQFGLIPYTQALLLSRYIRGDIDGYPPFFWR